MTGSRKCWKGGAATMIGGVAVAGGLMAANIGAASAGAEAVRASAPAPHANVSAQAMPRFRLPFPCGQVWRGNSTNSSVHTKYEIDFNQGPPGNSDEGRAVVAAAAGKVIRSIRHTTQSGYGNHVVVRHAGGYTTWYAHLKYRSVRVGQTVSSGTKLGAVGRTTKPSRRGMTAHLHYELRTGFSYPPIAAYFEGRRFGYPNQTLKACAKPAPTPEYLKVCGGGKLVDYATLQSRGRTIGRVFLVYKGGYNCVVTSKYTDRNRKTAASAYLQVRGSAMAVNRGSFKYYAGPVKRYARGHCVKWGGSIGSVRYTSPFEHCG